MACYVTLHHLLCIIVDSILAGMVQNIFWHCICRKTQTFQALSRYCSYRAIINRK